MVRRGLAEKINMVPAGTPTNAVYAKLPDYVTITGTIGDPKEKINKGALLGTALQQLGGNIPGVTRTVSIDIYDEVQALNYPAAAQTALVLLLFSFVILSVVYALNRRVWAVWPMR